MRQRQVKKILKKQGKLKQEPTVQEALDVLWLAINGDPVWRKSANCLFIGSRLVDDKAYGRLYDASNNEVLSSEGIGWEQHVRNIGIR